MKKAQESSRGDLAFANNFEQLVELGRHGHLDANDQHVVHIVDWLWQYAFDQRASDIHVEPRRDVGMVRFRIDGVLHQVYAIPTSVLNAVTSRIKLLARMEIVEKRRPQDGRIKTVAPDGEEIELRISTMPTAFGEKIVMRIFSPEVLVRDFQDLGFTADDRSRWESMTGEPHGIILVTGPTGSGKTTTLYSTLKGLATPEVNVCSIEDPIEMIEPAFNQMQVQPGARRRFRGRRADAAAPGSGHHHGGRDPRPRHRRHGRAGCADRSPRAVDAAHERCAHRRYAAARPRRSRRTCSNSTLLGVMAQRLVRTLCPHCKIPAEPPDDPTWATMTSPWRGEKPQQVMAAGGCLECRMTGYLGRVGLYEIMLMTPALRRLLTKDADDRVIREQAYRDGMKPLRVSGAMKVASGLTTVDEVIKVAPLA